MHSLRLTNEFTRPDGRSMSINTQLIAITPTMAAKITENAYLLLPTQEAKDAAHDIVNTIKTNGTITDEMKNYRCEKKTLKRKEIEETVNLDQVPDAVKQYCSDHSDMYNKYQKLGGKAKHQDYVNLLGMFYHHTLTTIVYGDTPPNNVNGEVVDGLHTYNTKDDAIEAFMNVADVDCEEYNRIFVSVDSVHAYT